MKWTILFFFVLSFNNFLLTQVDKKLADMNKEGISTSIFKLEQEIYPQIPSKQNGAAFFEKAFKLALQEYDKNLSKGTLKSAKIASKIEKLLKTNLPYPQKQLKDWLRENQQVLELLHQGAAKRKSRYFIDVPESNKSTARYPSVIGINYCYQLLQAEAILYTKNKPKKAVKAIIALQKIIKSLLRTPFIIAMFVAMRGNDKVIPVCEYLLAQKQLSKKQLLSLAKVFHQTEKVCNFKQMVIEQICLGVYFYHKIQKGYFQSREMGVSPQKLAIYKSKYMEKDMVYFLDVMRSYLQLNQLPKHKWISSLAKLKKLHRKANNNYLISKTQLDPRWIVPQMSGIMKFRLAKLALVIESYRADHKKLPQQLSDLVPRYLKHLPRDYFYDSFLQYKKMALGYKVYSVGADGKNDSGNANKDIVFTVKR